MGDGRGEPRRGAQGAGRKKESREKPLGQGAGGRLRGEEKTRDGGKKFFVGS